MKLTKTKIFWLLKLSEVIGVPLFITGVFYLGKLWYFIYYKLFFDMSNYPYVDQRMLVNPNFQNYYQYVAISSKVITTCIGILGLIVIVGAVGLFSFWIESNKKLSIKLEKKLNKRLK